MLAEHDPAAARRCGERRECRLGPYRHLTLAGGAAELLDAIGVHGGARSPVAQVAAARAERMRTLDTDVSAVKREGVAAFHAVPLERLQVELGHDCVAVVRIEDVDV